MNQVPPTRPVTEQSDPHAAAQLLPLVYDELRRLAAHKLAGEQPGQTLDATALVHEAYLRLAGQDGKWDNRGHFFAAAAEAMRRILIESARRKKSQKHGGDRQRLDLQDHDISIDSIPDNIVAVDEALTKLALEDPLAAEVVKFRFYAGLSIEEIADALSMSRASAYRHWTYARAWLRCALQDQDRASQS